MIAVAGHADADAVVALWAVCGLTRPWNPPSVDFGRAVDGATSAVLVARDGGMVVGSVMVGHDGHRGWLYYLAVSPDRRGEGLGRALVGAAEAWLAARGVPKVQLMVREGNAAAGFYAAIGYTPQAVTVLGRFLEDVAERPT